MLLSWMVNRCNYRKSSILYLTAALVAGLVLLGCGGGGGGGSSSGGGMSYTGQTSPAAIDASNAQEIAADAYQGMQTGESMNPFSGLQATMSPSTSGRPVAIELFETFENLLIQADVSMPREFSAAAVQSDSDTMNDECGGVNTASYTISFDDETGVFSGSFSFNNFCSDSAYLSGSASFSGVVNLDGGDELFNSFTFRFSNLTMSSTGESYTLNGELSFTSTGSTPTVVLDMLVQNNMNDEIAWLDDYTLSYDGVYVTISGTFYHYEYGRVAITTEQALDFGIGQDYPSSGVIVFTGALGSAIRVEAISATECQITADTDGDENFDDFDSDIILWTDIDN